MKKKIIISGMLIVIILAVGIGFWVWKKNEIKKQEQSQLQQEKANKNQENTDIDMSDWKTYKDEKYGFEIKYDPEWEMMETHPSGMGGEPLSIIIDKNRSDTGMGIIRFESNENPREWYKKNDGGIGGTKIEKEYLINNYQTYYSREDNNRVYLNHAYVISNNGKLIIFSFMEKYRKFNQKTKQYDETSFSQYLSAFKAMVHSIKFTD